MNTLQTTITLTSTLKALPENDFSLFKALDPDPDDLIIITPETIFHPQGGGQPSDIGFISSIVENSRKVEVVAVRTSVTNPGVVLHLAKSTGSNVFVAGEEITQSIDVEKRLLYSRLHTAGHVLGAAVRHLLESQIPGFDELKASHFPDSAACEFRGLIEGKYKEPIQTKVDEYIAKAMPVEIDWWDENDFRANNLARLIPPFQTVSKGEKFRVVKIVGAEVYPCGGTHVDTTDLCGKTVVRKIGRSKGTSRVAYTVS